MYSGYITDANMIISFFSLFGDAFRISAGSIFEKALGTIIHNSAIVTLKTRHTTIPSKIVLDQIIVFLLFLKYIFPLASEIKESHVLAVSI